LAAALVSAAQPQERGKVITPNFQDADIQMVAEMVQAVTGKTFIMDPRVRAQVTMRSSTAMSPPAFYQAFLSILEVYGFNAEPAGDVIKIVPDANARQHPGNDLPERISSSSDEFVTEVIDVRNVSAAQLVPILRPMIPQYGHLAAYPASNLLIISDRSSNVARMIRIIKRMDQLGSSNQEIDIVPLQNASAAEVARVVSSLYQGGSPAADGGVPVKVLADDRSNALLISGDQQQRLRVKGIILMLDTPAKASGDTKVRYLQYADAEKIAPKLKEQITGIAQASAQAAGGQAAANSAQAAAEKNTMVWADAPTNSLVITAPPKIMQAVMSVIDKLDIRRPQVIIEAIIADMDTEKSASLGVNWATFSKDGSANVPLGAFVTPVGGTSIVDLAAAAQNPANISSTLLQGATFGVGRLASSGVSFAAMLRALRSDSATNIISTPSTITLDNQEATMKSAEEVPFVTGQFTNTTATQGGAVNPFQTIQRQEVGTILKVTPSIAAEGNEVMLKISIEDSSIGTRPAGAVDLVTNKRTVSTNVLIEDGGVVVLGGLTKDQTTKSEDRVPFLGNIPLIGLLFKARSGDHTKNNLMIFIRPKIIREPSQTAFETESKYRFMQHEEQRGAVREILPILPFEKDPRLPPLPPPPPPGKPAPASAEEKEQASKSTPSGQTPPSSPARPELPPSPTAPQPPPSPQN
jgi:general secretion pathway protein D